jgi:Na+/H+-dicarboxylate symporter
MLRPFLKKIPLSMTLTKLKKSLTQQILLSTFLAIITGGLLHTFSTPDSLLFEWIVLGLFDTGGQLFLSSLKMLVIPLVFFSLATGVAGIQDAKQLGRMGLQTLIFFLGSTVVALILGLSISSLVSFELPNLAEKTDISSLQNFSTSQPSFKQTLINLVPTNPIEAMSKGETLQVIVFAILLGWAISQNQQKGQPLLKFFENFNAILLDLILMLVKIAPLGVFCLLAKTFSQMGLQTLIPLAQYFLVLLLILVFHGTVVYGLFLKYLVRVSPLHFFKRFSQVQVFAFSTSSSNATLPVTLEVAEKRLGISNRVAAFVIPLGATLNMNGTSIMQAVATVFISQVYHIELTFTQYLSVVATATLAAIGTAGVPGVGLVMLAMVLQQVNLPVEGIGLILGVDRILDMVRTSINVTGDAIAALWVAKSQPQSQDWDESVFYTDPQNLS